MRTGFRGGPDASCMLVETRGKRSELLPNCRFETHAIIIINPGLSCYTYFVAGTNPATREVIRGVRRIELTNKEYALLEYMIRNAGRILTRSMIAEHVWNIDFDTETNVIDVYVTHLRNKIDKGEDYRMIKTIRGVGYMLQG